MHYLISKYKSLLIAVTFATGFFLGVLMSYNSDKLSPIYGCNQIARWHADYMMREYGIVDGFNTDLNNPRREFNQKASDLNLMILKLCLVNPETITPELNEFTEKISGL